MDPRLNIVVVEDHNLLRQVTVQMFTDCGHHVLGLSSAEEVEDVLGRFAPDLFVIDIGLPGEDGLSLCARLRKSHPGVGIVLVTARVMLHDKVVGYNQGADMYLPKPVDTTELLAAVHALGRRVKAAAADAGAAADADADAGAGAGAPLEAERRKLRLNQQKLTLKGRGETVALTTGEAALLAALARAPGNMLEHWQVAANLGNLTDTASKSSVEVRVARLRKKLVLASGVAAPIKAVRLQGYQLCVAVKIE